MDKRGTDKKVKMGVDEFGRELRRLTQAAALASGALDKMTIGFTKVEDGRSHPRRSVIQGRKAVKRKMARRSRRNNRGK